MILWILILLALFLGIFIGTLTGLAPGIHINLVSAILLSFSGLLITSLGLAPIVLIVFLVAVAITHTFIDYIPSIFLGAPNEDDTALAILPGHEMLLKGEAYSAVVYAIYGCLIGIFLTLILTPIFIFLLPKIYPYVERIMPLILLTASFFLIYFEKKNRVWAIIIFLLSGVLGLITLNLPIKEPLLPLFTGLFGFSSLITSLGENKIIKSQKIKKLNEINLPRKSFLKTIFASILASPLCSFLPGMGSGQAAVIGSEIVGDIKKKEFLVLLGTINTLVTALSFVTLYSIAKARTGVAVAVGKLSSLTISELIFITIIILVAGLFAFYITLAIAKKFSILIMKVNYNLLSLAVILILTIVVLAFSGPLGLLLSLISGLVGLTCIYSGIRRTHLMGCLIIPSIVLIIL